MNGCITPPQRGVVHDVVMKECEIMKNFNSHGRIDGLLNITAKNIA